tara:strand:- start:23 stop:859 length:837 start_codon:yes stop_codon:yes gene_type:complete
MDFFKNLNSKNHLKNILYVNTIIFIFINIIYVIIFLFEKDINIMPYLGLSSNLELFQSKPWTIITYMFIHQDIIHISFNLIVLYFGGKIFINYLSQKSFLSTYFMGGLFGAMLYIISFNIFPVFEDVKYESLAIGASASVLAVLFSIATYTPNFQINTFFRFSIKLKHVAIIIIMIDLLSIPNGNAGGHIAHLGGALYGYIYISMKKYNINTNYIFDTIYGILVLDVGNQVKNRESDYEYNARKKNEQKNIDAILDKISESGYESLSDSEKEELFNQR